MRMSRFPLLALGAVVALAACTPEPPPRDEQLKSRSIERWNALIANDAEAAWTFFSPGYRASVPVEQYRFDTSKRPVQWKAATFQKHECESEDACVVVVSIKYQANIKIRGVPDQTLVNTKLMRENWIKAEDGFWYHVPDRLGALTPATLPIPDRTN